MQVYLFLVIALVLALFPHQVALAGSFTPTASPIFGTASPVGNSCGPAMGVTKKACEKKIKACAATGPMKWTGRGCRSRKAPSILGDGGCQCVGYCGYSCKSACNKDKECTWSTKSGSCLVKSNSEAGVPIPSCSANTLAPTPQSTPN